MSFKFDDRWVVPYNPALLIVLDSHVNVMVTAGTKSITYTFKYAFKSPSGLVYTVEVTVLRCRSRKDEWKK